MITLAPINIAGREPDTAEPAWRTYAACRGLDTDIFYPGGRGKALRAREQEAKAICANCPVQRQCRQAANDPKRPERYGVWGGATETERGWQRR